MRRLSGHGYTKPPPGAQIDWGHPLARGLVGCWLFNEAGGIRANGLAAANHGLLGEGIAANMPVWAGQGLRFDGLDDYVDMGYRPELLSPALSIFARIYPIAVLGPRDTIAANGNANTWATNNYIFGINNTNSRLTFFGRTPASQLFSDNNAYRLNCWNSVGVTVGDGTLTFYAAGTKAGSMAATVGTDNTRGGGIGATYGNPAEVVYYFRGFIDIPLIYSRVLSPSEVTWLAAESYAMIQAPVSRRWFLP